MSTLLYRFDRAEAYPLLSTYCNAGNPVSVEVEGKGEAAGLKLVLERRPDDPAEVAVVLSLPLVAIDGKPQRLQLDLTGDMTGCRVFIEAADSRGSGVTYELRSNGGAARRTWTAEIDNPSEWWEERDDRSPEVVLPLQLFRLRITIGPERQGLDVCLHRLSVTGEVHFAATGIAGAGGPRPVA